MFLFFLSWHHSLDHVLWTPRRTAMHIPVFARVLNTRYASLRPLRLSLIRTGLLQHLDDAGSPPLANRAPTLSKPTSLRTSDRKSLLTYTGLPLDVFGKVHRPRCYFREHCKGTCSRIHSSNPICPFNRSICCRRLHLGCVGPRTRWSHTRRILIY